MTSPTTTEVQEMKDYLRIEHDEDDSFIETLILTAREDLTDSGIKNRETERYKLAVKLMVANFYDQRRPQAIGTIATKLSYSLDRIILQLKAAELPEGDTE